MRKRSTTKQTTFRALRNQQQRNRDKWRHYYFPTRHRFKPSRTYGKCDEKKNKQQQRFANLLFSQRAITETLPQLGKKHGQIDNTM